MPQFPFHVEIKLNFIFKIQKMYKTLDLNRQRQNPVVCVCFENVIKSWVLFLCPGNKTFSNSEETRIYDCWGKPRGKWCFVYRVRQTNWETGRWTEHLTWNVSSVRRTSPGSSLSPRTGSGRFWPRINVCCDNAVCVCVSSADYQRKDLYMNFIRVTGRLQAATRIITSWKRQTESSLVL